MTNYPESHSLKKHAEKSLDSWKHSYKAHMLLDLNKINHAIEEAKKGIEKDPEDYECYNILSAAYNKKEDYTSAIDTAKESLRISPNNVNGHLCMAIANTGLKNKSVAKQEFKKALTSDPKDPSVNHDYAYYLMKNYKYDLALEHIKNALQQDPNETNLTLLGHIQIAKNEYKQAEETLKKALELNPNNEETHTAFIWLCIETGRKTKAIEHAKIAVALNPDSEITQNNFELAKSSDILTRAFMKIDKIPPLKKTVFLLSLFFLGRTIYELTDLKIIGGLIYLFAILNIFRAIKIEFFS